MKKAKDFIKKAKTFEGEEYYVALFPADGKDVNDICYLGKEMTMVKTTKEAIAFTNLQDIIHNVNLEELKHSENVSDVTIVKQTYKIKFL